MLELDDEMLRSAKDVCSGESLRKKFADKKSREKARAGDIVSAAFAQGVEFSAQEYAVSETSVVKLCILEARKNEEHDVSSLVSMDRVREIEDLIIEMGGMASLKSLLMQAGENITEWELRLVRELLRKREENTWGF